MGSIEMGEELGAAGDVEFFKNPAEVGFHGLFANEKLRGNFLIFPPQRDLVQNLLFTSADIIDPAVPGDCSGLIKKGLQAVVANPYLPFVHGFEGLSHERGIRVRRKDTMKLVRQKQGYYLVLPQAGIQQNKLRLGPSGDEIMG